MAVLHICKYTYGQSPGAHGWLGVVHTGLLAIWGMHGGLRFYQKPTLQTFILLRSSINPPTTTTTSQVVDSGLRLAHWAYCKNLKAGVNEFWGDWVSLICLFGLDWLLIHSTEWSAELPTMGELPGGFCKSSQWTFAKRTHSGTHAANPRWDNSINWVRLARMRDWLMIDLRHFFNKYYLLGL